MTWLAVRIHFEFFFWEIETDLLIYGPAFLKSGFTYSVTIKIFKPLKQKLQKGNRRLILNIVIEIRDLIVKSITTWGGWLKSRKVVLMQEQIFLQHFTEAHSTKASHHPPEPSTKLLQCSTNWAMKTHTLAVSQFFYFFFLIREGNETWNKDNVNSRNTRYDRHSCYSILSNCKLTQINLRGLNATPPLFWLWSWIPIQFLRQHEI